MATTRIREALELLDGGRRWYRPGGWGPLCMYTALGRYAIGSLVSLLETDVDAMASVALEHFPDRVAGPLYSEGIVFRFNDHPDTTFADVELVMEKAAIMREEAVE